MQSNDGKFGENEGPRSHALIALKGELATSGQENSRKFEHFYFTLENESTTYNQAPLNLSIFFIHCTDLLKEYRTSAIIIKYD